MPELHISKIINWFKEDNRTFFPFLFKGGNISRLFKDQRDSFNGSTIFYFLFGFVLPNLNLFMQSLPKGHIYATLRKIFSELRIIAMNIEMMPWVDDFIPFIKQLRRFKRICRDLEILCINFDRLINWSHRIIILEKIRLTISSFMAFIRLICLKSNTTIIKKEYLGRQRKPFKNTNFNKNFGFVKDSLDEESDIYL